MHEHERFQAFPPLPSHTPTQNENRYRRCLFVLALEPGAYSTLLSYPPQPPRFPFLFCFFSIIPIFLHSFPFPACELPHTFDEMDILYLSVFLHFLPFGGVGSFWGGFLGSGWVGAVFWLGWVGLVD
jgi:hypothetical protein